MKTFLVALVVVVMALAGCRDKTITLNADVIVNSANTGTVITSTDYNEAGQ